MIEDKPSPKLVESSLDISAEPVREVERWSLKIGISLEVGWWNWSFFPGGVPHSRL
jgi:hypothetical protein